MFLIFKISSPSHISSSPSHQLLDLSGMISVYEGMHHSSHHSRLLPISTSACCHHDYTFPKKWGSCPRILFKAFWFGILLLLCASMPLGFRHYGRDYLVYIRQSHHHHYQGVNVVSENYNVTGTRGNLNGDHFSINRNDNMSSANFIIPPSPNANKLTIERTNKVRYCTSHALSASKRSFC